MLSTSSMYRLSMAPSGAPPICCSIKSSLICRTWSIALSLPPYILCRGWDFIIAKSRSQHGENQRKLAVGACNLNIPFPDSTGAPSLHPFRTATSRFRFALTARLVKHIELRRLTPPLPVSGNGFALRESDLTPNGGSPWSLPGTTARLLRFSAVPISALASSGNYRHQEL